jgi:hypothetical protein
MSRTYTRIVTVCKDNQNILFSSVFLLFSAIIPCFTILLSTGSDFSPHAALWFHLRKVISKYIFIVPQKAVSLQKNYPDALN